jgi:asparagine synthase (glutamine-hydrolysing)
MCGILGIANFKDDLEISKQDFTKMLNSMQHRGPDDSDVSIEKNVILGHRRLSIIDLSSKGKQPMFDSKKDISIVFNGEIYNYMELKSELTRKYKFSSKSDTEVIIYSYLEKGIDCVKDFNGMFSFALFDKKKNKLFIVRDRLGIKPLYYTTFNNNLIFSSEIKGILNFPSFKTSPNLQAISSYLSYRYVLGKETLFENIYKLLPGHYMEFSDNQLSIKEYWDIHPKKHLEDKGRDYYKKTLKNLLKKSVERRMISDVPVGAYLSGGLDSSIIAALMAQSSNKIHKVYTVTFNEDGYDEKKYAKLLADKYNLSLKEIKVTYDNYFETLTDLIKLKDSPLSVPNEIPIYLMSKILKEDITVVLSGEGADEIFNGYGRMMDCASDYYKLKFVNLLPISLKKLIFPSLSKFYKNEKFSSQLSHLLFKYNYFPLKEKEFIFNIDLNKDKELKKELSSYFYKYNLPYKRRISYFLEKIHLPGLLERLDTTTMAASVEGRVPFLDHELVEFSFTIPEKYKISWKNNSNKLKSLFLSGKDTSEILNDTKVILREAFKKDIPKEILERKKVGFPVPLDEWYDKDFFKKANSLLLNKDAKISSIINQDNLKIWFKKYKHTKRFAQKVWMLVNLEIWLQEYF